MQLKHWLFTASLLLTVLFVGSCGKNRKNVDVSGIKLEVRIKRLDQDLAKLNPDSLPQQLPLLQQKYGEFLPYYFARIMGLGDIEMRPNEAYQQIAEFLTNENVRLLLDTTLKTYPQVADIEKELTPPMKRFKYYFPTQPIPEVITLVSYFNVAAITYDSSLLGIGTDMYLGKGFSYPPEIPSYISKNFYRDFIVPNSMKVLVEERFVFESFEDNRLIARMINKGKELYLLDLLMPEHEDYLKIDYQPEQIDWCNDNEPEIWRFFLNKELIYSTNLSESDKYVNAGPNTAGMPAEAPGNIGSWVGWQIVRKYMDTHPEVSFEQLLKMDAQQILIGSKYKPRHGLW
ncbi:MAG: hypothetical protein SFW35_07505 [Chitinophagales bacterium]|nr:hypothetical protein [Chitinophagales bacterium]